MASTQMIGTATPGDVVVVQTQRVGKPGRLGEILEVLGEPGHLHYKVRWDDGHVSLYYPSNDATVRHPSKGGSR